MDPNHRLYLNFNNQDNAPLYNARGQPVMDRHQPYNDPAYPTTPSTFPQPIYDRPPGSNVYGRQQQQPFQQAQVTNNARDDKHYTGGMSAATQSPAVSSPASARTPVAGGGAGGYFPTNPYQSQYQQSQRLQPAQPPPSTQPAPQASAYAQNYQNQPAPYQLNPLGYNQGDATNGLAQQFAHQNLGPAARQAPTFARQPSPAQGPPPTTPRVVPPSQLSNQNVSAQTTVAQPPNDSVLPERKPGSLAGIVHQRATVCMEWGNNFFLQSVKRAQERNSRQISYEKYVTDPTVPVAKKEAARDHLHQNEADYLRFLRTKEVPQNFDCIKIIGKGAFGEVKLVKKKSDGRVYALKSLVKAEMFKKDQLAHVRAERDILAESESPWVVKLFTTFQDANFLYMLMEFLPGGDLMTMLIKYEIFSEDITRFYMAEIILAIEAVHQLHFVHRDIKPDNILLDKDGHIKLTDFGLSTGFNTLHDNSYYQRLLSGKSNKARDRSSVSLDQINLTVSNRGQVNTWRKSRRVMAYSTVGTPDYIAPEIFSGHGYTFDCDWWSLGTIMFECLVGWPPFCADDPHDTYRKIVNWRHTLYFPNDIQLSAEAEHLIRSLVCDVSERLGHGGANEIKAHAFFRGVVFDQLRKIEAPFRPKLKSNIDVTYFPTDEIDQTDTAAALRAQTTPEDEDSPELVIPYLGYTFKRFNAFRGSS